MGRWSVLIAQEFLAWLAVPPARSWLDVGCGTGSLTQLILDRYQPTEVVALDSSPDFIAHTQQMITNPAARFQVGLAQSLDIPSNSMDAAVSGLVLNFVPQPETAVTEMRRVTKPEGTVGVFLWDYAEGMEMLRYFWDTAVTLNPHAAQFDEGLRFPLCREGQLEDLVRAAGLPQVAAIPIEVTTNFPNFADYWQPFLGHVSPAPSYTMRLPQEERQKLADNLRQSLPIAADGSISLTARAWAVKGTV